MHFTTALGWEYGFMIVKWEGASSLVDRHMVTKMITIAAKRGRDSDREQEEINCISRIGTMQRVKSSVQDSTLGESKSSVSNPHFMHIKQFAPSMHTK
jgi:hypothetical protein